MYNRWLHFFFSPHNEIKVRGKKNTQPVSRQWLDNGSMKLSGNKPSSWSVILQPAPTIDLRAYIYNAKQKKKDALEEMRKAVESRDEKLFRSAEKEFINGNNIEKQGNAMISAADKKLKNIEERLVQVKRNLYVAQHKKEKKTKQDITMRTKLIAELKKLSDEQLETEREIETEFHQFSPESVSIRQHGPYPEPPVISQISSIPTGRVRVKRSKKVKVKKQDHPKENEEVEDEEDEEETEPEETEPEDTEAEETEGEETGDEEQEAGERRTPLVKVIKIGIPVES